jgi:hypothetical protein
VPLENLPLRRLAPALAALALAVAGCLGSGPAAPAPQGSYAQRLAATVPPLAWDGGSGVAWWEDFAQTYTKRDVYLPNNDAATAHIADSLRALGLGVQVLEFPGRIPLQGQELPVSQGSFKIQVVVGTRLGTTQPDHAIAVGAHYDTQSATVQGAYDNGAGTAMAYNVCRELAKVPMEKTLLCLFFDGEESGVQGSDDYLSKRPPGGPAIDVYLGYDMTGMNWPGYPAWKLYNWVGQEFAPDLFPLVNATLHEVLGWPPEGAEAFPKNDRNSDEYVFAQAHVPTVRFAGGRRAADYDQYHLPDDTVAHVYQVVGGRANFQAGFGAIVQESYTLALMLDRTSLDELRASA